MTKISFRLDEKSIDGAIGQIRALEAEWDRKLDILIERLATLGATSVSLGFQRAIYSGKNDVKVSVEKREDGYAIIAESESVLFIEFGSGDRYGKGHPQNAEFGMGPGTWSDSPEGKGHWKDPRGWWIPKENGGGHTYGNPPSMTMYRTARELEQEIQKIAEEVFRGS